MQELLSSQMALVRSALVANIDQMVVLITHRMRDLQFETSSRIESELLQQRAENEKLKDRLSNVTGGTGDAPQPVHSADRQHFIKDLDAWSLPKSDAQVNPPGVNAPLMEFSGDEQSPHPYAVHERSSVSPDASMIVASASASSHSYIGRKKKIDRLRCHGRGWK